MKIVFSGPGLAATGALAVGVLEGGKLTPSAVALDKKINGGLRRAIKAGDFTGKANQGLTLMVPSGTRLDRVVAFGLGKRHLCPVGPIGVENRKRCPRLPGQGQDDGR